MSQTSKIWDYATEVLRLLSPTSWLPSAVFVGETALLLAMRAKGTADIPVALRELAHNELLVVLFLVLATMATEALAYRVLLVFMGYFNFRNRYVLRLVCWRIHRHQRKVATLRAECAALETMAWREARSALAAVGVQANQLDIIEQSISGDVTPDVQYSDAALSDALQIPWRQFASTSTQYRLTTLFALLRTYPAEHRILPTMLGNVLRAKEDALVLRGEELEGYVIRHYGKLPPMMQDEHHVHRTRMVLYCWLTLVFGLLAVLNPLLLAGIAQPWIIVASVAAHLAMAWISYGAAVGSAQGYGVVLQEIERLVNASTSEPATND